MTDTQNNAPYQASQKVGEHLQQILVNLIDLQLVGKQAHWNVVGSSFIGLHEKLDELVVAAREFGDDVAERMRAVFVVPDGRTDTVASKTTLPEFPKGEQNIAATVDHTVAAINAVNASVRLYHDDIDAEDPTTADMLHGILERLEQLAWMVGALNVVPGESNPKPIVV